MSSSPRLLVFTDLDGTLLDHNTYQWSEAVPALSALKSINAGLILASSKTAPEIAVLREDLEMQQWPSIIENGAGLLPAHRTEVEDDHQYLNLTDKLNKLPGYSRAHFVGFGDMTDTEVAEITGLTVHNATLAKKRGYSEPGCWTGNDHEKEIFIKLLKHQGISAQQGGRFLTLSFGSNKADQLRRLTACYKPTTTIALGDAPNDIEMLEAADLGIIVSNPHAPPLPLLRGEKEGRIIRTKDSGPVGWNATILNLLRNPPFNKSENP